MASEARSGGARRVPLRPRDGNAAASPSLGGAALAKSKAKAKAAAASPPSVRSYAGRAEVESRAAAVVREKEVSLAEELEKARERRGRLRAARQVTERALAEADEALRREMREWERRADEQRRVVAELMRLIGMPEVYVPVESLRSREERKRKQGTASSDPPGPVTVASTLLEEEAGADPSDQGLLATPTREATTESSST
ncbi:hypothetical protein CFC21_079122 [Triticum aestivum]|uniref:RAB6-interacting golgin n=2 Tax=Triticum aestivum TaxID=4565 RepID=A0A9R1I0B6_WHEAT|nr:uncharacterized protein LOC109765936 [Aegilops tauschii subsp. strangulata]XP_044401832.1 uncharacterized protein LOC123125396 [Triticum aestivum]KAF7074221.1 hypothetical protein CFC21_079122 [Triticum aestivum]